MLDFSAYFDASGSSLQEDEVTHSLLTECIACIVTCSRYNGIYSQNIRVETDKDL